MMMMKKNKKHPQALAVILNLKSTDRRQNISKVAKEEPAPQHLMLLLNFIWSVVSVVVAAAAAAALFHLLCCMQPRSRFTWQNYTGN